MAEKSVALEVLSYHATSPKTDLITFLNKYERADDDGNDTIFHLNADKNVDLSSYIFDDFSLNKDEMILASYRMFKKSGLMKKFMINKEVNHFVFFVGAGNRNKNKYE